MANYKIEALWDCIYCGNKGSGGRFSACSNCGHTRGKEVTFYLPKETGIEHAVDLSKTKVSQEPDWLCEYCRSYNSSDNTVCTNCGGKSESSNKDYGQIWKERGQ